MVVEPFLVIAVAAFDFSVVPGCPWPNQLVYDPKFLTEYIHGMYAVGVAEVCEFSAVVGLDHLWLVLEIDNCVSDEVRGRVTALLFVWIDESLSRCLVDHRVLIEPLFRTLCVACRWYIFDIHLPFNTDLVRCIIVLQMLRFLLCGLRLLTE